MGFFQKIIGALSEVGADVDANNQLKVALPQNPFQAGFVVPVGVTRTPFLQGFDGRIVIAQDNVIFEEQVDGNAINSNKWIATSGNSGVAPSQANGLIALSAGSAANGYSMIQSSKNISLYSGLTAIVDFGLITTNLPAANAWAEIGLLTGNANTAATDGVFLRWNGLGQFVVVANFNGTETTSPITALPNNTMQNLKLVIESSMVTIVIDSVMVANLAVPNTAPFPCSSTRQPVVCRVFNGSSAPTSVPQLQIGNILVVQGQLLQGRTWSTTQAMLGQGAYQHPTTYGQTANHVNSANPAAATLSNTVAGYTTLGGRFQFAAPDGAATDFALFGFQVPAGRQLLIKSVAISLVNTGAAVAGNPTIMDWALGVNASNVSLATTDTTAARAPRRIPLGIQSMPVGSAIGFQPQDIERAFDVELIVDGGRYVHLILQIPIGSSTNNQVIRGTALINGYYE